jgi:hypothetical protein
MIQKGWPHYLRLEVKIEFAMIEETSTTKVELKAYTKHLAHVDRIS